MSCFSEIFLQKFLYQLERVLLVAGGRRLAEFFQLLKVSSKECAAFCFVCGKFFKRALRGSDSGPGQKVQGPCSFRR